MAYNVLTQIQNDLKRNSREQHPAQHCLQIGEFTDQEAVTGGAATIAKAFEVTNLLAANYVYCVLNGAAQSSCSIYEVKTLQNIPTTLTTIYPEVKLVATSNLKNTTATLTQVHYTFPKSYKLYPGNIYFLEFRFSAAMNALTTATVNSSAAIPEFANGPVWSRNYSADAPLTTKYTTRTLSSAIGNVSGNFPAAKILSSQGAILFSPV